jgi:hypothetical protein
MTREHAARLGELLNQGTWAEVPHQNRFSPAFMGRTLDVLVDPIETFNEWTSRLWNARDDVTAEQAVDAILKDPTAFPGAGRSYPTVLMYLRDSSRYAVWLRQTHRGLAAISSFGDPVGRTGGVARYLRYCEAANRLAQEQGLEPQELDAVLSMAGRAAKDEESAPDAESTVLAPDDADTETGAPTAAHLYPLTAVAAATYLPISLLEEWTELLNGDTRQALLYGPPGTGKTYVASQLARHLAGSPDRVSFVQFHPSFSYEDFIEGLRPSDAAEGLRYEVRPGLFKEFCQRAAGSDDTYVYVIDEINRADLGSVLGELLMLLEYRGRTIRLPYSQKPFSVPHNIILLATMNTADRSLALVDYALRRRFHAFQMLPNRVVLADYLASRDDDVGPALELFDLVQNRVASDEVAPGHSYWMTKDLTATGLDRIWRYQLRPYLSEYWFEHPAQLQRLDADVATLLSEET